MMCMSCYSETRRSSILHKGVCILITSTMKKKNLTVFLCFLGMIGICKAQDFEPSSQAQGYLKDKNAMVDHYTGTFHYKVPLFELKSGNFSLPISLNYSGDLNNINSLTSRWWSLQVGGIVTRIVRGGIPDETPTTGYIYVPQTEKLTNEEIVKVNAHERDGEADIFTAVFNGHSVNFILEKHQNSLVVCPLEHTNVIIECSYQNATINSWSVTDENGIVYLYTMPEYTRNLSHEAEVSTQGIDNLSYISSWYLSSIIIPGAPSITFSYLKDNYIVGMENVYKKVSFERSTYRITTYQYSNPMRELRFNFDGYKDLFDECIASAKKEINRYFLDMSLDDKRRYGINEFNTQFYNACNEVQNVITALNTLQTIMGVSANYSGENFPTVSVMNMLNNMISYYGPTSKIGIMLKQAESYITRSFRWTNIDSNRVKLNSSYKIESPLLEKISTLDQSVLFRYNGSLREIILQDYKEEQIQKISLDYDNTVMSPLAIISWKDMNDQTFKNLSFEYDNVGYLNRIRLPNGGQIKLGYDGAFLDNIRSIDSGVNGQEYTIKYRYPNRKLQILYNQISTKDTINYPYCGPDYITFTSHIMKGIVYVHKGNYGVCHLYVEEELEGGGCTTYHFSAPNPSGLNPDNTYSFWSGGLLLGKAMYDKDKKLVYLLENTYATDMDRTYANNLLPFEAGPTAFNYSSYYWQVQPSEYYLNAESLAAHYFNQPKSLLYTDIDGKRHYLDPIRVYELNIQPRRGFYNPKQCYKLYYGGKTILVRQKEFRITGDSKIGINKYDIMVTPPSSACLISDTEYKYDNPKNSSRPTRVIKHLANGDKEIMVTRTVADVNLPDTVIKNMRLANVLSPVVKEQRLLQKAGSNSCLLIEERVTCYREMTSMYNSRSFVPDRKYTYCFPSYPVIPCIPENFETRLFTGDSVLYSKDLLTFKFFNQSWLAVEHRAPSGTEVMLYDKGKNNLIFQASHIEHEFVDAVDRYRTLFLGNNSRKTLVNGLLLPDSLVVKVKNGQQSHDVYFLIKPATTSLTITCNITQENSVPTNFIKTASVVTGRWQVVKIRINTANYTNARDISVKFPEGNVALGVLVPEGTIFKAHSYLPVGLLFGQFDQNCKLETREYNSQGRFVKTFDQEGNLLQEIHHES